jgi:hypothetical protein
MRFQLLSLQTLWFATGAVTALAGWQASA